jgi:CheY-like chemotaxis protein
MIDKAANCRALTVLCAASGAERLAELKRAAVAAEWELVGGAASLDELLVQLAERQPDLIVLDTSLGADAAIQARRAAPRARIVSVGPLPGVDEEAAGLGEVRAAILGVPRNGGPAPA